MARPLSPLCPECLELVDEDGKCTECGFDPQLVKMADALKTGRIKPKLRVGDLFGEAGNIWYVLGTVYNGLKQLGFSKAEADDLVIGNIHSRTYVENLRHFDTIFELVIDGPGDESWTLDEFLVEYQGRTA